MKPEKLCKESPKTVGCDNVNHDEKEKGDKKDKDKIKCETDDFDC
jgi:hypothetical protein